MRSWRNPSNRHQLQHVVVRARPSRLSAADEIMHFIDMPDQLSVARYLLTPPEVGESDRPLRVIPTVGGATYHIPWTLELILKPGDTVKPETDLTGGLLNIADVVKYKGIGEARKSRKRARNSQQQQAGISDVLEVFARAI